jgi:hypothetical protein
VPGTTGLNIDLPLTLLLLIAAVAWMRGVQHLVDGFDIIVTVVVLIELPMVLDMLPEPAQRGLLIAALLAPAIASIWKHLSGLDPQLPGRPALRALAVTCLGYATLAGLVWTIGISGGGPDQQPEHPGAELSVGAHCPAAGRRRQRRAADGVAVKRPAGRPAHPAKWDWLGIDRTCPDCRRQPNGASYPRSGHSATP